MKIKLCRVVRRQALQSFLLYLRLFALGLALRLKIRVRGLLQKIRICLFNCVYVLFLLNVSGFDSCVLVLLFGDFFAFLFLQLILFNHVLETGDFERQFDGKFLKFAFAK